MQVREARVEDCPGIARVQVDSYQSAYVGLLPQTYLDQFSLEEQAQDWRDLLASSTQDCLYVAVTEANEVIGYALGRSQPSEDGCYTSELVALHVRRAYHRQGIGRRLIAAIASHLQQCGGDSLYLTVLKGNPASGFYAHLGGQQIGERSFHLDDGTAVMEEVYGWADIGLLCQP